LLLLVPDGGDCGGYHNPFVVHASPVHLHSWMDNFGMVLESCCRGFGMSNCTTIVIKGVLFRDFLTLENDFS